MIEYEPEIIYDGKEIYVKLLVKVEKCKVCDSLIVRHEKPFPEFYKLNLESQLNKVKIRKEVYSFYIDWGHICEECKDTGKVTFKCSLCNEEYPTSEVQESFGYLSKDHLCKKCYNSVPASVWESKVSELRKEHQYDWD